MLNDPVTMPDLLKSLSDTPRDLIQSVLDILRVMGFVEQFKLRDAAVSSQSNAEGINSSTAVFALTGLVKVPTAIEISKIAKDTEQCLLQEKEVDARITQLEVCLFINLWFFFLPFYICFLLFHLQPLLWMQRTNLHRIWLWLWRIGARQSEWWLCASCWISSKELPRIYMKTHCIKSFTISAWLIDRKLIILGYGSIYQTAWHTHTHFFFTLKYFNYSTTALHQVSSWLNVFQLERFHYIFSLSNDALKNNIGILYFISFLFYLSKHQHLLEGLDWLAILSPITHASIFLSFFRTIGVLSKFFIAQKKSSSSLYLE